MMSRQTANAKAPAAHTSNSHDKLTLNPGAVASEAAAASSVRSAGTTAADGRGDSCGSGLAIRPATADDASGKLSKLKTLTADGIVQGKASRATTSSQSP